MPDGEREPHPDSMQSKAATAPSQDMRGDGLTSGKPGADYVEILSTAAVTDTPECVNDTGGHSIPLYADLVRS